MEWKKKRQTFIRAKRKKSYKKQYISFLKVHRFFLILERDLSSTNLSNLGTQIPTRANICFPDLFIVYKNISVKEPNH